ncbi:zinc transporter 2, partial [Tanacetum coccineum]
MSDFAPGRAVTDAAHRKRGKYMAKCAGYGFLPFSFSSLGELETDAVTLLKRVRNFSMAQDIGARAAGHIFNRIGFSIAKGVGAQIVSRLPSNSALLCISLIFLHLSVTSGHGGSHDEDDDEGGEVAHHDLNSKGLVLVKVYCLIIMFVTTFAGGVSPYFYRWNESFLLLGTQFAGGVFLGTSLMHFLSDSNETFGDLTKKPYPFAFMLACFGYLLTMFGDCVILYVIGKGRVGGGGNDDGGRRWEDSEAVEAEHGKGDSHHPMFVKTSSLSDTVLLILALCFHSIFEGIAVGVS